MAIEQFLGEAGEGVAEQERKGSHPQTLQVSRPFLAPFISAALITRGAAYALAPRFYALERKNTSLFQDTDVSSIYEDEKGSTDVMKGIGVAMVGGGGYYRSF